MLIKIGYKMNFQQMMKQDQTLQKKIQDAQKQFEDVEVTGSSGGGMVVITVTAKGAVKKVNIDKSLANPEEIEVLEDLLVAALNNAKDNADKYTNDEMDKLGISPELIKNIF